VKGTGSFQASLGLEGVGQAHLSVAHALAGRLLSDVPALLIAAAPTRRYDQFMVANAPTRSSRLDELRTHVSGLSSVLVCFSAGIDSTLVLAVASEQLKERAVGFTAVSPSLPAGELEAARQIASQLGTVVHFVESHELDRPGYASNGSDRCFHCKSELYELAESCRTKLGLDWIVNGTNVDDLGDYRPGLDAAKKAGVRSPLLELGFSKSDTRAAALDLGLQLWDKPAAACLSSRIPYGVPITPDRLTQVERLESKLKALGFRQVRVRWHGEIARIEVEVGELSRAIQPDNREDILKSGKECGFQFVTVDLAGYRTGSLNELLSGRSLKLV